MKTLVLFLGSLLLLSSCVFDEPFETEAKFPVDPELLGRWETVPGVPKEASEQMLVLQHSPNEYFVEYPVGVKANYFRAFAVELAGSKFIQIQLLGTASGPEKPEGRKYDLVKVVLDGDSMELRTVNEDVLGKDLGGTAGMRAAFVAHKDDPKLFGDLVKFRRIE